MGLVTFSLFNLWFSLETANPRRTMFSSELLENPMLLKTTALSILTIVLAAQFGPLQRLLDTVDLNAEQWALCILVSLSIVVIAEIRKALGRGSRDEPTAVPVAATAPA